jgi:hypothetical protein
MGKVDNKINIDQSTAERINAFGVMVLSFQLNKTKAHK